MSSTQFSLDLGAMYRPIPKVTLGLSGMNINSSRRLRVPVGTHWNTPVIPARIVPEKHFSATNCALGRCSCCFVREVSGCSKNKHRGRLHVAKVTGVKRIWGLFKVAEVEVTVPGPLKKSTERFQPILPANPSYQGVVST